MPPFSPTTLTRFFGRDAALERLAGLFSDGARFVTLFGPGGIGKTRLALAYAARHESSGVLFFDLAEARTAPDVCRIVVLAMGLRLDSADGLEDVVAAIERALAMTSCAVVVFDNCEQLDSAAAAALGAWCNGSTTAVVVTSRTLLGLPGEQAFEVPSMEDGDAARLFVDRARLIRADYDATADSETIAAIVARLEGMPLAIELAAGCLDVYSPATLLSRLSRSLDELTTRARVTVARHASMRAALDPSWQALEPWEKTALATMTVFHGGFSLEAAESVIDVGAISGAPRVSAILSTLRAKSLLRAYDEQGVRRFALYEGIRQFADEHLDATERSEAEKRHASHFRSLAERSMDPAATDFTERSDALVKELGNVNAVFQRALDATPVDADTAWTLILALDMPFRYRGASRELARMAALASDRTRDAPSDPRLRARAYAVWARTVHTHGGGDAPAVIAHARELAEATNDDAALGRVRFIQAIERAERTPGEASPIGELALALELARRANDYPNEILVLKFLADAARRADEDEDTVRRWCDEALARARQVGDLDGEITMMGTLALIELSFAHLPRGAQIVDEVVEKARRRGSSWHVAEALYYRAAMRRAAGDLRASLADFDAAYAAGADVRPAWALTLAESGVVLHELGELDRAIGRYEEALPQLRELHVPGVRQVRAMTHAFLGDALAWVGNDARADVAFSEARDLAPGAPHAEIVLELLTAHRGLARSHDGKAREAARRALDGVPSSIPDDTARVARRMLERALVDPEAAATSTPAAGELVVGPQCRWIRLPPGERIELVGVLLRAFMGALVEQRQKRRGEPLTIADLLAVGWPGERMQPRAGKLRVWNIIARLRGLGLRDILLTVDDGYRIDPRVTVRLDV